MRLRVDELERPEKGPLAGRQDAQGLGASSAIQLPLGPGLRAP